MDPALKPSDKGLDYVARTAQKVRARFSWIPRMGRSKTPKESKQTYPPVITIGLDSLRYVLRETLGKFQQRDRWLAPFSILVTLFATILVSDFKTRFGLSAPQWYTIAGVAVVACTAWLAKTLIAARKSPNFDAIVHLIYENSLSRYRQDAVLFLRARDKQGTIRFLVYFDKVWECYFCPHMRIADASEEESIVLQNFLSATFDISADHVSIVHLAGLDLQSTKKSETTGFITDYNFNFVFVKIDPPSDSKFSKLNFQCHGRSYKWITLEEAREHESSLRKNGDVLTHMRDHYQKLFLGSALPLSVQETLR